MKDKLIVCVAAYPALFDSYIDVNNKNEAWRRVFGAPGGVYVLLNSVS